MHVFGRRPMVSSQFKSLGDLAPPLLIAAVAPQDLMSKEAMIVRFLCSSMTSDVGNNSCIAGFHPPPNVPNVCHLLQPPDQQPFQAFQRLRRG